MKEQIKWTLSGKKVKGIEKIIGLMFKRRHTDPLIFEFNKDVRTSIHSLFVFFPFKVIWYDKDDNVIEERIVKPFRLFIRPKKAFRRFIEVPL